MSKVSSMISRSAGGAGMVGLVPTPEDDLDFPSNWGFAISKLYRTGIGLAITCQCPARRLRNQREGVGQRRLFQQTGTRPSDLPQDGIAIGQEWRQLAGSRHAQVGRLWPWQRNFLARSLGVVPRGTYGRKIGDRNSWIFPMSEKTHPPREQVVVPFPRDLLWRSGRWIRRANNTGNPLRRAGGRTPNRRPG